MSFFPGNDPQPGDAFACDADRTDGHPERQGHRRLRGAPCAADRQAPARRPLHLLRPHGAGHPARRPGARRAAASAYRARHRHLSVRRQDPPPRFARHRDGHRAGRREPDDGGPRHRAFRAHARGTARRADVDVRPADLARPARGRGGGRAAVREHGRAIAAASSTTDGVSPAASSSAPSPACARRSGRRPTRSMPISRSLPARACRDSRPMPRSARSMSCRARSTLPATVFPADRLLVFRPGDEIVVKSERGRAFHAVRRRVARRRSATSGGTSSPRRRSGSSRPSRNGRPAASTSCPATRKNSSRCRRAEVGRAIRPQCRRTFTLAGPATIPAR